MEQEKLHFKIGLSGSSTRKQPEFKIQVGGNMYYSGQLSLDPGVTEYFEFDAEVIEGSNTLTIELLNKSNNDTVVKDGVIVDDLLLNIDSIEIDEIDLGALLWSNSVYVPIYPDNYLDEQQKQIKEVRNCVNLGWNGAWNFPFASPFYIWLLENI
jgi:hypothetical protein